MSKNNKLKQVVKWLLLLGVLGFVFLYFKLSLTEYGFKGSIQRAIPKKWNGIYKEYYANGTLKAETPYRFGREHGLEKQYYEDGSLSIVTEYKDGKAKISKQYYPSGELMAEDYYDNEGYGHGITKIYFKDGRLKDKVIMEHGKWKQIIEYHENGNLKLEEFSSISGKRWRKEYDKNGNLVKEGDLYKLRDEAIGK
ncbi:MAG: hypothetical protein HZA28_04705 [Candidatus Omnitrophica bacterium]|nr:hypothetical protein [Candidatus Omnitrophota bacterium]